MLIEAPPAAGVRERFTIEAPKPAGLIMDVETGENGNGENGTGTQVVIQAVQPEVDVMAPKKDTRSAGVDGWVFKVRQLYLAATALMYLQTRNSLMFPPDADMTPYQNSGSSAAARDPKIVKHGNTRLPEQEESTDVRSMSAPPSPTRSRIDAAISGTPCK